VDLTTRSALHLECVVERAVLSVDGGEIGYAVLKDVGNCILCVSRSSRLHDLPIELGGQEECQHDLMCFFREKNGRSLGMLTAAGDKQES
jgi:hypothetical protein